tara:strand:+ start:1140 stop:1292 length:153 start_codon:yes stop_codon:yes gene_type:complete
MSQAKLAAKRTKKNQARKGKKYNPTKMFVKEDVAATADRVMHADTKTLIL